MATRVGARPQLERRQRRRRRTIFGRAGRHLDRGDQLEAAVRITGFGHIGDIARATDAILFAISGVQIVQRLQAAGIDLLVGLGLRRLIHYPLLLTLLIKAGCR